MDITKFSKKLNKIENNVYTIEEEVNLVDNVYDADLEHDNIDPNSISVYTGSKLTGQQITTWNKSIPSLNPCRTHIKIYSTITPLYITYETVGDTVEADDINELQDTIIYTQNESNAEKDKLTQDLDNEVQRASLAEANITTNLNNEISRATNKENAIQTNLNNEVTRAKAAESTLTTNLNNEVTRAKAAESTLTTNLSNEVTRATKAEGEITTNLNNEISRATTREDNLKTSINSETTRATNTEQAIQTTINTNKPIWDDKYTKNEIDNKISQVISDIDWKESVATYNDIATTYPSPQDGWTVNVKDTDITYRYSGSKWIEISANSIPLATSSVDGKMSKDDKSFLDTIRGLWTNVTTHISDVVKHITSTERTLWNTVSNKAEKDHNHDSLIYCDLTDKTIDLNDYTINDGIIEHRFYRCRTIGGSSNISNKPVTDAPFSLEIECIRCGSTTDFITKQTFTSAETMCDYTRFYHSNVNAWTKWETNYNSKNLTKVSQLSNDAGYLTQADIDTSQNHIHSNKTTLDKITEDKITSWDGKLDKTGGTVTGRIICNGGTTIKSLNGGSGTAGYMHVAIITIGSAYQNQPISFDIQQRNRYGSIILQFQSANSHDPDLSYIQKRGNIEAYIVKSSAGVWDLYVQKSEGYDVIEVIDMGKGEYMTLTTIEWKNVTVTTLPTGYITAGKQYIDMSVDRANKDSDGNIINETYVKKNATNSTPFYKATELGTNSYKVTTSFSWTSLLDGYNLRVAIPTNATGATSLTVDSVTAPIKLSDGSDVSDLKAGGVYALTYYNGNFICASAGNNADDVTFTSNKLLTGYTANDSKGKAVEGTMKNNGAPTSTLSCGSSYKISEGYYSGGTITANSLASQTQATAGALQIVPPYTAWVNGAKVTGSMNVMSVDSTDGTNFHSNATNCEYGAYSNGDSNPYLYLSIPQWSYTTKNGFVRTPASAVANKLGITADKIVSGNTICGVTGTAGTKIASGVATSYYNDTTTTHTYYIDIPTDFTPKAVFGYIAYNYISGIPALFQSNNFNSGTVYVSYYRRSAQEVRCSVENPANYNMKKIKIAENTSTTFSDYPVYWWAIG